MKYFKTFEGHYEDQKIDLFNNCCNVIQWSNMFKNIVKTIKYDHNVLMFENDRGGKNECGHSLKGILFYRFGEFGDRKEVESLAQFIAAAAEDLANKFLFGTKFSDKDWDDKQHEFILELWKITIENDSALKIECPADVLKELGYDSLGNMKNIGTFD